MPRFHFQTIDAACGPQEDSCELPDLATAREIAVVFAGDVLREVGSGIYAEELRVVVTDDAGDLCWDVRVTGAEGPGARRA